LDTKIVKVAVPALINFAIVPFVGAADTFWVGRMNNALALAGQGAANQVFSSTFWVMSFLLSVMAPMVAKAYASGNKEVARDCIGQAFLIAGIAGLLGTAGLVLMPGRVLNLVLASNAPARMYAVPYLAMRGLSFTASLLCMVAFAAYRGTLDIVTPLKITAISNIINVVLDPMLIFSCGMGVPGAALATCIAEFTALVLYVRSLMKRGLLDAASVLSLPSRGALLELLAGGASVQLRALALNAAFVAVTRTTQQLDTTGTTAAAHSIALQLFQLGSVASSALSVTASAVVPSIRAQSLKEGGSALPAKQAADRLLLWGLLVGVAVGALQLLALPVLGVFSPLPEVQRAARLPALVGAALQVLFCVVYTGEGVQQGNGDFAAMAASTALGTAAMLLSLRVLGGSLAGVWASFGFLGFFRLLGTLRHHFVTAPWAAERSRLKD
jgi:MATE family multidrug resistance protein